MAKYDLGFTTPVMNAAGSLGFYPAPASGLDWMRMGAFVTNPVSPQRRLPAHPAGSYPFPGGFILHTGYPNPGLRAVIRRYAARWKSASLPVLVHLLGGEAGEIAWMVRQLEGLSGVAGIELGLPPQGSVEEIAQMIRAAGGELPLVVRLPLDRVAELAGTLHQAVLRGEAAAVSLGPPRGAWPDAQSGIVHGRIYGPGVYPQALEAVQHLARQGAAVIGAGGIYTRQQADTMLAAGALAVQVDAVLWRGEWEGM